MTISNTVTDISELDKYMFTPKTEKIRQIARDQKQATDQLEKLLGQSSRMYIDYANVRPWSNKLGWHIDISRLKQFLDSFSSIEAINFYSGYLKGDSQSERDIKEIESQKYIVRTKPVKIMKLPIDASSVPTDSTALLNNFVKRALLRKYEVSTIEFLNERFKDLNRKGEYYIEDRKCNFDVEIGVDMLLDCERHTTQTFVLWSGDSDFTDPMKKILQAGRKAILFATAGRVSRELSELRSEGLVIFEIQKIKDFICWNRELKKAKGTPKGAPKL